MARTLLEEYKGRLAISEKFYSDRNNGAKMGNTKKMLTAQCLANTAKYLNEAFTMTAGTQRADLGAFKIFCMDITTLTMPNLIINDIFMVQPMSSFQGYITYMEYGLGERKGGVGGTNPDKPGYGEFEFETKTQNPFVWEPMTEDRSRYTGEAVVDTMAAAAASTVLAFTPVVKGAFVDETTGTAYDVKIVKADGTVAFADVDPVDGKTVTAALDAGDKVAYRYDNQLIPQERIPGLRGHMKGISLVAKARRIGIEYSQFAAFQAKQDYGIDFESTIAQQAQAELEYEIDGEAVFLVKETADRECTKANGRMVTWVDEELDTISYSMKAEGFARVIEKAKAAVYKTTGRFMPNWMLVSPDMMSVLRFVPGFAASNASIANGPYVAGNIDGIKVIVSPALGDKVCYLGVLGADGKTAVGVYAPYMPIVPTQLLGFADGTMSQGFSTLYDMKILNPALLAKIEVKEGDNFASVLTSEI